MNLIDVKNLTYSYPRSDSPAIRHINLQVKRGEFILLIGRSACGKSTLARSMCRLVPDFYGGNIEGDIVYKDIPLRDWNPQDLCAQIGMVFQDPDSQFLFGNVERDIAFGLENLGMEASLMKRRVAEMVDYLNLNELRDKHVSEISGGEKQKIALAGVLAMKPDVLILDEPTSQLDPLAADDFFNLLKKINDELGISIILIEQRLERAFILADRVVVMDSGTIVFQGSPAEQLEWAIKNNYSLLPTLASLFAGFIDAPLPLTVKEGRQILGQFMKEENVPSKKENGPAVKQAGRGKPLVEINKLSFTYSNGREAIKDLDLQIGRGEIVALVGANGAGKTTLLKLMMGFLKARKGRLRIAELTGDEIRPGNIRKIFAYLPQNIQDFFLADSLLADIKLSIKAEGDREKMAEYWLDKLEIAGQREDDPRKMSAGEKQKAALACLLAANPEMFLLDEPTMGIDREQKTYIGNLLSSICLDEKKSALIVSHDMEFISEYATRLIFMHQGRLIADGAVETVLADNIFYTSQVMRVFRGFGKQVINQRQAQKILAEIKSEE